MTAKEGLRAPRRGAGAGRAAVQGSASHHAAMSGSGRPSAGRPGSEGCLPHGCEAGALPRRRGLSGGACEVARLASSNTSSTDAVRMARSYHGQRRHRRGCVPRTMPAWIVSHAPIRPWMTHRDASSRTRSMLDEMGCSWCNRRHEHAHADGSCFGKATLRSGARRSATTNEPRARAALLCVVDRAGGAGDRSRPSRRRAVGAELLRPSPGTRWGRSGGGASVAATQARRRRARGSARA